MRILVIDIGGTNVKVAGSWDRVLLKIESGPTMTAGQMAERVLAATKDWDYDVVSIGYPGPVKANQPVKEPRNIGGGWKGHGRKKEPNRQEKEPEHREFHG